MTLSVLNLLYTVPARYTDAPLNKTHSDFSIWLEAIIYYCNVKTHLPESLIKVKQAASRSIARLSATRTWECHNAAAVTWK